MNEMFETPQITVNQRFSTITTKPLTYYKDIRMKADTKLHSQVSDLLFKYAPPSMTVLDFGCGEGALSQRLKDIGYTVLSVDIDCDSFKADTDFEQLDFDNKNACERFYQKYAEKFDIVLGLEVIEHIQNPWEYIGNLARLCKPSGHICISTPNITSWYSRVRFLFSGRFRGWLGAICGRRRSCGRRR